MIVRLLIDGYNLLHATGAVGSGRRGSHGPGQLARARQRLLQQLSAGLSEEQRLTTQIVFDAHRKVTGDEEQVVHGMTVTYSAGFEEADDLLEQIIRQHPQPRTLTVISSDLRVQRTAKARKAQAVSCDQWLMQLLEQSEPSDAAQKPPLQEPQERQERQGSPLLSAEEVARWLDEFGFPP
jgi:predicted RNA-binding protein with PIN domain